MSPPRTPTNWFVAAGAGYAGDGSIQSPFHDLWQALHTASPGDAIHVATGTYFGRYDRSSWIVDCPDLTIRGGYSANFAARNPWKTPSILAFYPGYRGVRENNMLCGRGNHSGLTLDGLLFDASGANKYGNGPQAAISWWPEMSGVIASLNGERVTICHCTFVNGGNGGVELSGSGSRFENNLLLNMIGLAILDLRSSSQLIADPIVVRNNSFCFIHDVAYPPGSGADSANGIRINCPAVVQDNLFLSCGNAGIAVFIDPARVAIDRNVFFLSPHDAIRSRASSSSGEITEKTLDELEDLGFRSADGNAVGDPGAAGLPPGWVDGYSRQLLANYAKPPREAANVIRAAAGLPALQAGDLSTPESKGALAPRLTTDEALKITFAALAGAHPAAMTATSLENPPDSVVSYRRIDWTAIEMPDPSLATSRVELVVGLGMEQNNPMLPDATPETHMGVQIFKPGSDDVSPFVFIPRWTLPARQYEEATRYSRGLDVETLYVVRGIYRTDVSSSRQKVTIVVDSVTSAPIGSRQFPAAPRGRDWFVRAGASGGDGSREKPYRDPFQAIEKAEGGDSIHVAAGDYFGRVHAGQWRLSTRNLSLLGGYNADFTARDPWENPCRFLLHEEEKAKPGRPEGTILGSADNSEGLVLDGFVFDGATWNTYKDGAIDLDSSPLAPLVDLRGGRAPIAVRNCVFVNGSCGAVKIACPYGEFANNVIVNTSGPALTIRADGAGPWDIRGNTLAFCGDPTSRAGTGESTNDGTLLLLAGRAAVTVDSNVFAFADNYGVRCCVPQPGVSFTNNALAANLYIHLTDAGYLWADESTWDRRVVGDADFADNRGNSFEVPALPLEPAYVNAALHRLFSLPSHYTAEDWTRFSQRVGSSVAPEPRSSTPEVAAAAPTKPADTQAAKPSLSDLMARLGHLDAQKKELEQTTAKPQGEALRYCPPFDWKAAMVLALPSTTPGAGARRCAINMVLGGEPQTRAAVEYVHIGAEQLDAVRATLNGNAIEIDVNELRESSTTAALFPAGTSKNDYTAYTVTMVSGEESPRTRLAVVVKDDTAGAKYLQRMVRTDRIRICGTAFTSPDSVQLSILVESAGPVGG